jgi:hypothetical protein
MLAEIHFLRLEVLARAAQEDHRENPFVAFPSASPSAPVVASLDDDKNHRVRDTAPS